jgi:hypothetical protein
MTLPELTTAALCQLLRIARAGFDASGEWDRQSRMVFLVLKVLGDRFLQVAAAETDSENPSAAFREILTEILDAVIARADAQPLAYAWLGHLAMSGGRSRRSRASGIGGNPARTLLHVATNLAAHIQPHPNPIGWIEAEQDVWRNHRIYAILAVEICRQPSDQNAIQALIEQVLENEIASSFGIGELTEDTTNLGRYVALNAISKVEKPDAWFQSLWDRLYWQRDRARHFPRSGEISPNVGQIIVVWTLCALEVLEAGSSTARALWIVLEQAIRDGCFGDAYRPRDDPWSKALRFLGGVWQRTFPDDPPAGAPGCLEEFLVPWFGVNTDFALLLRSLHRYGVPAVRLRRVIGDGNVLRLIAADSTAGGHSLLSPAEIDAIIALADEIDAAGV